VTSAQVRNFLQSVVLITGMGLIVAACTGLLGGKHAIPWALLALGLLLFVSPRIAPEFIMRKRGAWHAEHWPVVSVIDELAKRAAIPGQVQLYVIPSAVVNAFATGGRTQSVLAVTNELLHRLDDRELVGVLAHEMAHIGHNDLWIMNLADAMNRLADIMAILGLLLFLFSLPFALLGGYAIPWLVYLLLCLAPMALRVLQLGLSRAREYDADREGAQLSGDPEGLVRALQKMEAQGRIRESIFSTGRSLPGPSLLLTHPPIERRIRRLKELGQLTRPPLCSPDVQYLVPRVRAFGGRR